MSDAKQQDLKLQAELQLSDAEVMPILEHLKAQAKNQQQAYAQNKSRYEQSYREAIAKEHPLNDATREQLTQIWHELGLKERDVWQIEQQVNTEIATQHERQAESRLTYQRAYNHAARQQFPLSDEQRSQLTELGQSLKLSQDEMTQIEDQVNATYEGMNDSSVDPNLDSVVDPNSAPILDPTLEATLNPNLDPDLDDMFDPIPGTNLDPSLDTGPLPPTSMADMSDPSVADPLEVSTAVPNPPTAAFMTDALSSECNVDYSALQEMLLEGHWREADRETFGVMLSAANRSREGHNREDWLSPASLQRIPCTDLATISHLWEKHSNGHFGFIVQERIFHELTQSNPKQGDRQLIINLAMRLKWMWKAGNFYPLFRRYNDLAFSTEAVTGHLPALWYWKLSPVAALRVGTVGSDRSFGGADIHMFATLMKHLRKCNISS